MDYPTPHTWPNRWEVSQLEVLCFVLATLYPDLAAGLAIQSHKTIGCAIDRMKRKATRLLAKLQGQRIDLADDAVAQLLHDICGGMMGRCDPHKGGIRSFVFAALRNIVRSQLRKEKIGRRSDLDVSVVERKPDFDADDAEMHELRVERLRLVQQVFNGMNREDRIALTDKYPRLDPTLHGPPRSPGWTQVRRCRALDRISADPIVNGIRHR